MRYAAALVVALAGCMFYYAVFLFGPFQIHPFVYLFWIAAVLAVMTPRELIVYLMFGLGLVNILWSIFLFRKTVELRGSWIPVAVTLVITSLCLLAALMTRRVVQQLRSLPASSSPKPKKVS